MALPPPDDPERRLAVARRWCIAFALPHLLFAAFAVGLTVYFLMYEGDYAGIILGIGGMVSAAATLPGIMALVVGRSIRRGRRWAAILMIAVASLELMLAAGSQLEWLWYGYNDFDGGSVLSLVWAIFLVWMIVVLAKALAVMNRTARNRAYGFEPLAVQPVRAISAIPVVAPPPLTSATSQTSDRGKSST